MPNASKMREQLQIHTLMARALKQQVFRLDMQAVNVAFTCGANNEEKIRMGVCGGGLVAAAAASRHHMAAFI